MMHAGRLYLTIPLLLFLDVFLFGFFEQPIIATLACFYAVLLIMPVSAVSLLYALFFLSIASLLVHSSFVLSLVYLIPLSIAVLEIKSLVTHAAWLPYAFMLILTTIETIALPLWMGHMLPSPLFIVFKICGILMVVFIFGKFFDYKVI